MTRLCLAATTLALFAGHASAQLPAPPTPPENPITEAKRVLGKALFWDEQLSSDDTIACGTCHIPESGGADPRTGGFGAVHPGLDGLIGSFDDKRASPGVIHQDAADDYRRHEVFDFERIVTLRKAPSVIGAAHFDKLFWDGRAEGAFVDPESGLVSIPSGGALEFVSIDPILSSIEMSREGRGWDDVRAKLERVEPLALAFDLPPDLAAATSGGADYPALFAAAFGDPAIDAERIAFALATYQRTLNPDQTPWDLFEAGTTSALTPNQQQGRNAFFGNQASCFECHAAPLFSDGSFRNLGLRPIAEDEGRQAISGDFADRGKFKVPSLRNVGIRMRMMHQGEFVAMPPVMTFYTGGGGPFPDNKDPLMGSTSVGPGLSGPLVDFLMNGLTDPRVAAGAPPFDRPKLNSERFPPHQQLMGGAVAGSGGFVPQLIAATPPRLGSRDFKLGVHAALGGAPAFVTHRLDNAAGPSFTRRFAAQLSGSGVGRGLATHHFDLPNLPGLAGRELWSQFWILDSGASGGFAKSERLRSTLF